MNDVYKFCPFCKGNLIQSKFEYICKNCGKKVYINPAPCVSIIPVKDNKILLSIRGIEPKKGSYDFIGGFVDVGETIEEAVKRETLEETGLHIKLKKYLGEYSEEYLPGITYPLCFTYTVSIIGGKEKASDDVASLEWVNMEDIRKLDLTNSFPGVRKTLNDFLKKLA